MSSDRKKVIPRIARKSSQQRRSENSSLPHAGNASQRRSREKGFVAAVDIGGSNLRLALADLCGNVLGKWRTSTKATSSPKMVVAQIEEGVDRLLQQVSASRRSLVAIAAGAPGVTDGDAGIVLATSYLRGWRNVPLQALLESAFGIPAAIENDVRMAALGEHWTGAARGVDDFVFLALGTGIAAGIFANGKLIRGANCTAGEVGYMYVPGGGEEIAGPGQPGSLESMLGGEGIRQQWLTVSRGTDSRKMTATDIFALARAGDSVTKSVLDQSARLLAYAIYNISLVLNSSLFVLGGGVGMSIPLLEATKRVLQQFSEPVRPKLVVSSLGQDAQLTGAIRLALDTAQIHTVSTA